MNLEVGDIVEHAAIPGTRGIVRTVPWDKKELLIIDWCYSEGFVPIDPKHITESMPPKRVIVLSRHAQNPREIVEQVLGEINEDWGKPPRPSL